MDHYGDPAGHYDANGGPASHHDANGYHATPHDANGHPATIPRHLKKRRRGRRRVKDQLA